MKFDIDAEIDAVERRRRGEPEPAPPTPSSPIEDALVAALESNIRHEWQVRCSWELGGHSLTSYQSDLELSGLLLHDRLGVVQLPPGFDVALCRQVRVAGYIADVLIWTPGFALAVECDGHEFHERTRQQATYDKTRDRELLRCGVPTVRFTGTEIHRDANGCARELADTWRSIVRRWRAD